MYSKRISLVVFAICLFIFPHLSKAEYVRVRYILADWGPDLVKPAQGNESAIYNDDKEVVYCLKEVTYYKRNILARLNEDIFGPEYTQLKGTYIALCSMNKKGKKRKEIKRLWIEPQYTPQITINDDVSMDVCPATKKIVLSVVYAGQDMAGMWTFNLDGSSLKCIRKRLSGRDIRRVSWSPDGEWIVFEEVGSDFRNDRQVVKCDKNGDNVKILTDEYTNTQPCFSPDGKSIAYVHRPLTGLKPFIIQTNGPLTKIYGRPIIGVGAAFIHIMNSDGSNSRPIMVKTSSNWRREGKAVSGQYPIWNPNGRELVFLGGLVDLKSQHLELIPSPPLGHWGNNGVIGMKNGLCLMNPLTNKRKILASSSFSRSLWRKRVVW